MFWPFRKRAPTPAVLGRSRISRVINGDRRDEFVARGFAERHFFPHRVRCVPRSGSDGQYLAHKIYGVTDPSALRQIVLWAEGDARDMVPDALWFDDDLIWHGQHLGMRGHVAAANLAVAGRELLTTARYSDIIQRISRQRRYATRVEKLFRGWDHMLLNAIMGYAAERGFHSVKLPTADTAMEHTDKRRPRVQRDMFERIYDANVQRRFRVVRRRGWWVADVRENLDRIVGAQRSEEAASDERTVCICHDTEREHGHTTRDPEFARKAAHLARENLDRILDVEVRRGVRSTYAVVGRLLPELREQIENGGHEVAFHSFDHDLSQPQLARCRSLDYRIPGYRPPNSVITKELTDLELATRNFEWLASSPGSLAIPTPAIVASIARIPVYFDDFAFYKHGVRWSDWERTAVQEIESRPTTVFGLHDCYAHLWLPELDGFLAKLQGLGRVRAIGEVANDLFLRAAE